MKKIAIGIFVVLTGFVLCASLKYVSDKDEIISRLALETFKLSVQLLFVVIGGGILVQEYNRQREKRKALNDFRKKLLRDLIQSYGEIKKSRRLLRAKCVVLTKEMLLVKQAEQPADQNGAFDLLESVVETEVSIQLREIPYKEYEKHLFILNDLQLQLEVICHEIDTFKEAFIEADRERLKSNVGKMESYLRTIIKEYEAKSSLHTSAEIHISLNRLPALEKFIMRNRAGGKSSFGENFTFFFIDSLALIRKSRVKI